MRKLSLGDATALVSPPRYERWRCILIQEHCTGTTSRTPTIVTSYILLFLGLSHQLLARCTFIYLFLIAAKVHLCLGSIPTSASSQSLMWSAGHWMHDLCPSLRPWHTVRLSSLATVTFVLFHPQSRCRSTFTCSFLDAKNPFYSLNYSYFLNLNSIISSYYSFLTFLGCQKHSFNARDSGASINIC